MTECWVLSRAVGGLKFKGGLTVFVRLLGGLISRGAYIKGGLISRIYGMRHQVYPVGDLSPSRIAAVEHLQSIAL